MTEPIVLHVDRMETPIGELLVAVAGEGRLVATCLAAPKRDRPTLFQASGSRLRAQKPSRLCTKSRNSHGARTLCNF